MIRLGLTGSIGMGKSTTARMFVEEGVPVIDADAIVHELYQGQAVVAIEAAFPGSTLSGAVDRKKLSALLAANPAGFAALEEIVHPLVWERERDLLESARKSGASLVVLDIPLLFENGAESRCDKVAVVSCDPEQQRARVMARPDMTEEKFAMILARQLPDVEKRRRADFIIDTGQGLDHARQQVAEIVRQLREAGN